MSAADRLKIKPVYEKSCGVGRNMSRAAAWQKFEHVIINTFAWHDRKVGYHLANTIIQSLRAEDSKPRQVSPLRFRHVVLVLRLSLASFSVAHLKEIRPASAAQALWTQIDRYPLMTRQ